MNEVLAALAHRIAYYDEWLLKWQSYCVLSRQDQVQYIRDTLGNAADFVQQQRNWLEELRGQLTAGAADVSDLC